MKHIVLFLVLCTTTLNTIAQDTSKMKATAQKLLDATMKEDYATLLKYTYPKALALGGGMAKMTATIKTGMKQMKESNVSFHSVKLHEPGKIYKAGKELHCVIPQTTVMKVTGGYLTAETPLLCISSDGGKNWTYISAGNMDKEKIKLLFPNFNHALKLQNTSKPVFQTEAP